MVLQHERYVACRATTADSSHKMCALSFVHWLNFLDAARSDILMPLTWSGHQTLYHAAAWSSCLSDTHTHRWSYKGICIISSSKVNKKLMGFWPNWPVTIKQYLLCSTSSLYIHIYLNLSRLNELEVLLVEIELCVGSPWEILCELTQFLGQHRGTAVEHSCNIQEQGYQCWSRNSIMKQWITVVCTN